MRAEEATPRGATSSTDTFGTWADWLRVVGSSDGRGHERTYGGWSAWALPRKDALYFGLAVLCTFGYLVLTIERAAQPFEDAAIVMRYARHIADGHGIVWNIGDAPVDGATDFLFTLMLAAIAWCGIGIEAAARLLGATSHALTVGLVYLAIRRLHFAPRWIALGSAAYLAVGPATAYVSAAFGTPVFGLLAAITWIVAMRLAERVTPGSAWAFAISSLLLGLDRPEGVLLSGFMLLAVLYAQGWQQGRRVVVPYVTVFALLGGAYFAWHFWYFAYLLPNTFYKKGGGGIYWPSLQASFKNVLLLGGPFWLPFSLALRSKRALRKALFAALPIVAFATCWIFLSDEMNLFARFQYAVLPMLLISWPALVMGLPNELSLPGPKHWNRRQRLATGLLVTCGMGGLLAFQSWRYSVPFMQDGRYATAMVLREYKDKGYTIAMSEAGLLPFYSSWRALDTWGLNDSWIAHHGGLTDEYLDGFRPNVIMFNGRGLGFETDGADPRSWEGMVETLQSYARRHNYKLPAVYGVNPYSAHYYYVRPDFPDAAVISERLGSMTYRWRGSSNAAVNFLNYGSQLTVER